MEVDDKSVGHVLIGKNKFYIYILIIFWRTGDGLMQQ